MADELGGGMDGGGKWHAERSQVVGRMSGDAIAFPESKVVH